MMEQTFHYQLSQLHRISLDGHWMVNPENVDYSINLLCCERHRKRKDCIIRKTAGGIWAITNESPCTKSHVPYIKIPELKQVA
jgi:hypothetical protein